jgi:hypothetical protein
MDFNVVDVYRDIREKQKKRHAVYDELLACCRTKIRAAVSMNVMECVFTVPEFKLGLPTFDVPECTKYIKQQMEESGFYVKTMGRNTLSISWEVERLEAQNGGDEGVPSGSKQQRRPPMPRVSKTDLALIPDPPTAGNKQRGRRDFVLNFE